MSDQTLNRYVARGTNAARLAFTPSPPTPAAGPDSGYFWFETDTGDTYSWDGAAWVQVNTGAGGGAVKFSAGTLSSTRTDVTFADSNGISFGLQTNGVITGTVKTAYAGTNSAITGGSLTVNTSGISINLPAYLTTADLSANSSKYVQAWELTGNTAGTTSSLQGTKLYFEGGNSITVSGNSNTVKFSVGNYLTTAALSQDSSKYAGTNGAITGGSITVNTSGVSVNVAAQSVQTQNLVDVSLSGNTAGALALISSGTAIFAGGNNITLSQNGQSITISGPNVGGAQTGISGIVASDATYTSGTVTFSGVGGGVTVNSNTGQRVDISVGAYITTARASTDAIGLNTAQTNVTWTVNSSGISLNAGGYAGTNTAITGGSVTLNTSGISINLPAYLTTADLSANSSKYVQAWELTGNTAGTTSSLQGTKLYFEGGNSITVSGNSNTVKFSVGNYLTTARGSTDAIGLNTAQTNVTWTVNSSGISLNASRYAGTGLTTTTTAGTAIVGTNNTLGLSLGVPAYLTNATAGAGGLGVSSDAGGTTGSNALGTFWFSNLNTDGPLAISQTTSNNGSYTIGFDVQPAQFQIGISNYTNSDGTSGVVDYTNSPNWSYLFAGGNGITLSQSLDTMLNAGTLTIKGSTYSTVGTATTGYSVASANSVGTVTRWAAEDHRHAGVGGIGISTSGNTAGTTGSELGTYWLQGGNSITLSQITSNNGSHTLVISGPSDPFCGWLEPYSMTNTAFFAPGAGSWYFAPFTAPGSMSGGRFNFLFSNTSTAGIAIDITATGFASNTTGTKQQSYTYSLAAALYSQGAGANSTRLDSIWSNSFSFGLSNKVVCSVTGGNNSVSVANSWSISYISEIGSAGEYTLNQYAVNSTTNYSATAMDKTVLQSVQSSIRNMLSDFVIQPVGFNSTIPAGAYWIAFAWSSTTNSAVTNFGGTGGASALIFSQKSMLGISRLLLEASYRNWASTNTTARSHLMPYGLYTAAANMVPPTNVALSSDLSSLASAWVPYFNYQFQGITK